MLGEKIILSIQALCLIILAVSVGGIFMGAFLVSTYVKRRGFKTKSQRLLTVLARHIEIHHPEVVDDEGTVVDKAIKLMSHKPTNPIPTESKI